MTPRIDAREGSVRRCSGADAGRGFSLIELLVAIAIVTVLLSILLVGLRSSRGGAVAAKCLVHCRQCSDALAMYEQDYRGYFPLFAEKKLGPAFENGGMPMEYSLQAMHWPLAALGYLGSRRAEPAQFCPAGSLYRSIFGSGDGYEAYFKGYTDGYVPPSDYWSSYATITDPAVWKPGGSFKDPALYRGVQTFEVLFPAQKGLILEPRAAHQQYNRSDQGLVTIFSEAGWGLSYHVAFGDGHVKAIAYRDFLPASTPFGLDPGAVAPVLATVDGCRGRDVP